MNSTTLCNVAMVILFALTFLGAVADPDTQIINMVCNSALFTDDSLFAKSLESTMKFLVNVQDSSHYPVVGTSSLTNFFLRADCSRSPRTDGRGDCFSAIRNDINMVCKNNMGVQLTLQDCKLRYETYPFDGIELVV